MAKNKPQIRFQGHQDEWEECKLEKLGTWKRGQALSKTDICSHGKNPCIHYAELFAYKEIIQQIKSRTDLPPIATSSGNDLLFPDSDVTPDGLGRCSALTQKGVILGGGINILELNEQYLAPYCSLNVVKNRKQIIEKVTGATVRHIHSKDLDEVSIYTTTDKLEQKKIGELFRSLDELIEAKEQELEKLRQIKLALLDGMFPSDEPDKLNRGGYNALISSVLQINSQLYLSNPELNVPVIRFRGFTEPWKKVSLSENATFSKGRGYSKADIKKTGTPILLYGSLYTNYNTSIEYVASYADKKDGSIFSTGNEVVVPASGETAEDIARASAIYVKGIILGGDLNIIYPNEDIDPTFLALDITYGRNHKLLVKKAQGISVVHLHNTDIQELDLVMPDKNEQKKICDFFSEQDENIRSAQLQINKLRNIKQACMQKMFA